MKAGRFPLFKIHKIFDEMADGVDFATLDFFSGYWQIRLSERREKKTLFVCQR